MNQPLGHDENRKANPAPSLPICQLPLVSEDGKATGGVSFEWTHLEGEVGYNQDVGLLQDSLSLATASLL